MKEITYKLDTPDNITETDKNVFLELLTLQGKVKYPTIERINHCPLICTCKMDSKMVSIGAIKPKTSTVFDNDKADLDSIRSDFAYELGYCFTLPDLTKKGFSSLVVSLLLDEFKESNIMASTELRLNNPMLQILEKNNFRQFGKPWKSTIHEGTLGLFLKYAR